MYLDGQKLQDVVLNLEKDINTLKKILIFIRDNNPDINFPTHSDIDQFILEVTETLQNKYPNMGIKLDSPSDFNDN